MSLLSLSCKLLTSVWCPCAILPHFFIECGPKAFMETGKFQLLTRFKLFTSFWCPCTIFPHFVIEPGPEACMKTGKSQLFSRFELSIFNILPRTNLWALSLLKVGLSISLHSPPPPPPQRKKLLKFPTQLFRRRQNRRPWLSTRRLNRRLTLRFKFPTQARQRFKFPSPWAQTTVKCQWVSRGMLRWKIVFNCF